MSDLEETADGDMSVKRRKARQVRGKQKVYNMCQRKEEILILRLKELKTIYLQ